MCRMQTNTIDLLAQLKAGQAAALERLLERSLPPLIKFGRRRLPQWARGGMDTQDIVQDVIVRILPRLRSFQPDAPGALQAFLRRAVSNQIVDEIRKVRRRPSVGEVPESLPDGSPSPLERAIRGQGHERFRAGLRQLSPSDQTLIVLRLDDQLSYAEIAERLNKPSICAARVAVGRALARLAKVMAQSMAHPSH